MNAAESLDMSELPSHRIRRLMTGDHPLERFPGVLYRDDEILEKGKPPEGAIVVEGIVRTFAFHPDRLEQSRSEVEAIIREVVCDPFLKGSGDGYSTLGLCEDRNGNQWAEHPTMEELCCLAIGLKLAGWCLPRDFWKALPGSMPYVWFERPKTADVGASATK